MKAINMFLHRKLHRMRRSKTVKDEVAVMLVGTEHTSNALADDEKNYHHISVYRFDPDDSTNSVMHRPDLSTLRFIERKAVPAMPGATAADAFEMVVVGFDILASSVISGTGKKKVESELLIFSDLQMKCDVDGQFDHVCAALIERQVTVKVFGPSGPEQDFGESCTVKTEIKAEAGHTSASLSAESALTLLAERTAGLVRSLPEQIELLTETPHDTVNTRVYSILPLQIGILKIPVRTFLRQSKSKLSIKFDRHSSYAEAGSEDSGGINVTKQLTADDGAVVEPEDRIDAYRYGNEFVPWLPETEADTKVHEDKSLRFICFVPDIHVHKHDFVGDKIISLQPCNSAESATALCALCAAMAENRVYMIARFVYNSNAEPKLLCLWPHIKAKYMALLGAQIGFAEDQRDLSLRSFVNDPKLEPSNEQQAAMDKFVTSLDLMCAGEGGSEVLQPKNVVNPVPRYAEACIEQRALDPSGDLADIDPELLKCINFDDHWTFPTAESRTIENLFPLAKQADEKRKGKRNTAVEHGRSQDPMSGSAPKRARPIGTINSSSSTINSIIRGATQRVGPDTPDDDYRRMVADDTEDRFEVATKQLQEHVIAIVDRYLGGSTEKFYSCVKAMREQCCECLEPSYFNDFLKKIKDRLHQDKAKYAPFIDELITEKVTLITSADCKSSTVSVGQEDIFNVLRTADTVPHEDPTTVPHEDPDDMLDDL